MALYINKQHYCKWMYVQDGQVTMRKVNTIILQDPSGVVQKVVGENLPSVIVMHAEQAKVTVKLLGKLSKARNQRFLHCRSLVAGVTYCTWRSACSCSRRLRCS